MQSLTVRGQTQFDSMSTFLRIGLGLVFIVGGWNKLYQLLDPELSQAILNSYMGTSGYINQFFTDYLFSGTLGSWLTPWGFMTLLSSFELISGVMLAVGFLVRPLALFWAFLLWSFVVSLPVVTTPGVASEGTYASPAMFVQIRDIALSGLFFIVYNLGSGRYSLDKRLNFDSAIPRDRWDELGLLLRVSLALPLLVAGFFHGLDHIQTFNLPALVALVLGVAIVAGVQTRITGSALVLAMLAFIIYKLNVNASLIANLNGFKREFAFIAGGMVLFFAGGGRYFVPKVPLFNTRSHTAKV